MTTAIVPQRPTAASVMALVDLLVDAEKKMAAGPWDHWDENVLNAWRVAARAELHRCLERAIPDDPILGAFAMPQPLIDVISAAQNICGDLSLLAAALDDGMASLGAGIREARLPLYDALQRWHKYEDGR